MALVAKSLDEMTFYLCDAYDELIAPKRIWRNNNNKLYLFFRACAAGMKLALDVALALRNRFDPLRCSDDDLYATAKLVGTEFLQGSGSAMRVHITNTHTLGPKTLAAGVYNYASVSGMTFSFTVLQELALPPGAAKTITAVSVEKGSYLVGDNSDIKLYRSDGLSIDKAFKFSCEENSGSLGYPDEDALSFRKRVLGNDNRQDHLKELETKIRNLPNIFECGLKFNADIVPAEYDGVILQPLELLVTITGTPSDDLAAAVVNGGVLYSTHMVDPEQVVYYYSDQHINGKYPVYFRYHAKAEFSLEITYQYNSRSMKKGLVEAEFNRLLTVYRDAVTHVDLIKETDIYERLALAGLPDVTALSAVITAEGAAVPYLRIPATRTPSLVDVSYVSLDLSGEESEQP